MYGFPYNSDSDCGKEDYEWLLPIKLELSLSFMFTKTNTHGLVVWQHAKLFMSISETSQYWNESNFKSGPRDTDNIHGQT